MTKVQCESGCEDSGLLVCGLCKSSHMITYHRLISQNREHQRDVVISARKLALALMKFVSFISDNYVCYF